MIFNWQQVIEHWTSDSERKNYFGKVDQGEGYQNLSERLECDITS